MWGRLPLLTVPEATNSNQIIVAYSSPELLSPMQAAGLRRSAEPLNDKSVMSPVSSYIDTMAADGIDDGVTAVSPCPFTFLMNCLSDLNFRLCGVPPHKETLPSMCEETGPLLALSDFWISWRMAFSLIFLFSEYVPGT